MDYTRGYLELLKGHLSAVNNELISWEEIYESNERSLKNGDALATDIALSSHRMMMDSIEVKRNYYYEIESKIDQFQQLLDNIGDS